MQKINIKKLTKEQILAMLEEAMSKQEAAEATAARHFEDGVKLAEENEKLCGQIGELTARIENVGKELDKVRAQYKAADQSAAALKQRNAVLTESIEQMNGEAINRANELTNLKADAEDLRGKLAATETALGRANAEAARLRSLLEKERRDCYNAEQDANWAAAHPWRNLWAWVKRKLKMA